MGELGYKEISSGDHRILWYLTAFHAVTGGSPQTVPHHR